MSLRLFVYYCAICGAWAGLVGWAFGALLSPASGTDYLKIILRTSMLGMFLGLVVAFGLSLLDAMFNLTMGQFVKIFLRVFAAVLVGIFGGLFGSFVGGSLYYLAQQNASIAIVSPIFFVIGWTIVGFLIGASINFFEVINSVISKRDLSGSIKKFIKCMIGGTVGGILGGCIAFALKWIAEKIFSNFKDPEQLWSPTAIGFVALGACIGLLVGLAQILLKEAWVKVEAGYRPGREMILTKERTSIGRAEGSDIPFFGDNAVERTHAHIVLDAGRYYLVEDGPTPGGTFVNDIKVEGRAPLKHGDLIRMGRSMVRFNERAKRPS